MIKLKSLLKESRLSFPEDKSLNKFLLENKVVNFSDWLYHGTPLAGLKSMLVDGIYGTQHGEVAEYESFSTSVNSEVISLFSEMEGETGLQFDVKNIKLLIVEDILHHLLIQLPGSGMEVDVNDDKLKEFCEKYKIPHDDREGFYLPYGYLSSLGIDAFIFDYTWKKVSIGHSVPVRDESEVCFVGSGIQKLNSFIKTIYVYDTSYDITEKDVALAEIEKRL